MSVVPPGVSSMFARAGWFSGRRVPVDADVPAQHAGYAVLAELGGLRLADPAPNVGSIAFRHVADGADLVRPWEVALATKMVGIAVQDDGHAELYLTEGGQVIGCSLVHPACWLVGQTIQEAIEAIARGQRFRPMLLPAQDEVMLYGTRFRAGDNEVVGPAELA